jgi:hypothetical protein
MPIHWTRVCGLKLLPLIQQPVREFVHSRRGQVDQQLRQIEWRNYVMATAGAGQADQDRRRAAAARVPDDRVLQAYMSVVSTFVQTDDTTDDQTSSALLKPLKRRRLPKIADVQSPVWMRA